MLFGAFVGPFLTTVAALLVMWYSIRWLATRPARRGWHVVRLWCYVALSYGCAVAAWAVVPFGPDRAVANINAGLLFLMAITSVEVYGVIIAGWASNSKYAFLGALRASAQMVSYEIAMGFCFVVVLMVSGSMNLSDIVLNQDKGYFASMGLSFLSWNWLPLLPIFLLFLAFVVITITDSIYDYQQLHELYETGSLLDFGWPLGYLLLGRTLFCVVSLGRLQRRVRTVFSLRLLRAPPPGCLLLRE